MNIKKLLIPVGIIFILIVTFVVADYFALFGVNTTKSLEFADLRFRTVNAENGDLIMNVIVRCFQHRNSNICTNKEARKAGETLISFPYQRVKQSSLLFEQDSRNVSNLQDPTINLMFIHNNYHSLRDAISINDILSGALSSMEIKMQPRQQTYHEEIYE